MKIEARTSRTPTQAEVDRAYALAKQILNAIASTPGVAGSLVGMSLAIVSSVVLRTELTMLEVDEASQADALIDETLQDFVEVVKKLIKVATDAEKMQ